ncbi:MAG: TspO/MBR family protein [Candidatus Saccharibacteria bacterium]
MVQKTKKKYQQLLKPSWSPPDWLFGPVWSVLYIIIFTSFGSVFYGLFKNEIAFIVALPFLLNLVFNFSFTPIQFGLKNNFLAAVDILLILGTLIWAMISVWQLTTIFGWVALVNIPYLIWVLFATTLQLTITYLNRK